MWFADDTELRADLASQAEVAPSTVFTHNLDSLYIQYLHLHNPINHGQL